MFAIETRIAEGDEEYTNCILFTDEDDANEILATLNRGPGFHTLIDRDAPDVEPEPETEPGKSEDISGDFDPAFAPTNND